MEGTWRYNNFDNHLRAITGTLQTLKRTQRVPPLVPLAYVELWHTESSGCATSTRPLATNTRGAP